MKPTADLPRQPRASRSRAAKRALHGTLTAVAILATQGCLWNTSLPEMESGPNDTSGGGTTEATTEDSPGTTTPSQRPPAPTRTNDTPPPDAGPPLGTADPDGCSLGGCGTDVYPGLECDLYAQDCGMGEKCNVSSLDGGGWNATRCVPLANPPKTAGQPCTVHGEQRSGLDDCDVGQICMHVNDQGEGYCVAFCTGSPNEPTCEAPGTSCRVPAAGPFNWCEINCDPLAPACPPGQGCYYSRSFACLPDRSPPGLGTYGQPCEYLNACDPGLMCVAAPRVPGCQAVGCCTTYCDVTADDPAATCPDRKAGQLCEPFFVADAPEGLAHVGACVVPA